MSTTKLTRRDFISRSALGVAGLSLTGALAGSAHAAGSRPNFIFILTDDQGYDDLGIHGNKRIETPNLDAFAAESVQFRQFIVAPVCAPTRAAFLTGRQFLRTGVSHVHGGKDFISLDETLIPETLKDAGYATGMWGKWHSGKTNGYFPWQRGFDEAYMAQLYKHNGNSGPLNGSKVEHAGWTTNVLTDYAIDFIKRNKNKPFFAYLPYMSCHAPLDGPPELVKKYQAKGVSKNLSILYAMLDNLDTQIGRLLKALDDMDLAENTVTFFTSDNGPAVINDWLTEQDRETRYVNNFKGHKGNMWENGVRVPMFVRWKGKTKPTVVNELADITDMFPTLLDFAGVNIPAGKKPLDGRSIKPYILGETDQMPDKYYFNYASPGWPPSDRVWTPKGIKDEYRPVPTEDKASLRLEDQLLTVRNNRYKLMLNPGPAKGSAEPIDNWVLIDIQADPLETKNLYKEKPQVAAELKAKLREFWQQVLTESASFGAPVFRIGADTTSVVYAYGPTQLGGNLRNAALFLYGFKEKGDWAQYNIDVITPGQYKLQARYAATDSPNATIQISTENATTAGKLTGKENSAIGILNLQKGRATLRLELIDPANAENVNLKLESITFTEVL